MRRRGQHWHWWAAAGVVALLCLLILRYALTGGRDIGDYSTLVQAIFSIVLAFTTVASIVRADAQIEKAQAQLDQTILGELTHSVIVAVDSVSRDLVISNLSKYPVLIRSITTSFKYGDGYLYIDGQKVVKSGDQLTVTDFLAKALGTRVGQVNAYAADLVGQLAAGAADPEQDPLGHVSLHLEYNYGGTGPRVFTKLYAMRTDLDIGRVGAELNAWIPHLELNAFVYRDGESALVDIASEWEAPPLPPERSEERLPRHLRERGP